MGESPYSLLVFDWDGTLMDSSARIVKCIQCAAEVVGVPIVDDNAIRHMIGLPLEMSVRQLYPGFSNAVLTQLVDEVLRRSFSDEMKISPLFDGVETVLRQLAAQGYQLAVATGKSRRGLNRDMAEAGVTDLFPITRTADETLSKPNPLMLQEILTDYDMNATEALMIGDTEYDLQLARNAGMDALAVSYGMHSVSRLLQHKPCGIINDFAHLPDWLKEYKK